MSKEWLFIAVLLVYGCAPVEDAQVEPLQEDVIEHPGGKVQPEQNPEQNLEEYDYLDDALKELEALT